jgi:hypothetical protein
MKVIKLYADNFTEGDLKKARQIIKFDRQDKIKMDEAAAISLLVGALCVLLPLMLYLLLGKRSIEVAHILNPTWAGYARTFAGGSTHTYPVYDALRLCFVPGFIVLGSAGVVQLLRKNRINYVYIFGIQPYNQLNHWRLYAFGLTMLVIVVVCLLMQEASDIYDIRPNRRIGEPAIICFIAIAIFALMPLKIMWRTTRFEIIKSLSRCIIAPFTPVVFRDFFFADVLTSVS